MTKKTEIHDIFGIGPYGEIALKVTQASLDGARAFLSSVCMPGLEELGYLIKDRVRYWRLCNILKMLEKANKRMDFDGHELNLTANARVGISIMEGCSEVDDEELQDLWAGLFVSSCTPDGRDDSNMNFVDLLRRMSSVEARILDYACKNCIKRLYPNKLIIADDITIPLSELIKVAGTSDIYRLDCEMDHMRSIELLSSGAFSGGGFNAADNMLDADISPSSLALNLYYKTHCIGKSPVEFWGNGLVSVKEEVDK